MRHVIILLFAFVISGCHSQSHDILLGKARPGDPIIFQTNEKKNGVPFATRDEDVEFPKGKDVNNVIISAVHIKDNYNNGNGGFATIKSGGVNQKNIKIKLKSQKGHGYDFTITVFGRK